AMSFRATGAALVAVILSAGAFHSLSAQLPSIADKTKAMQRIDGFIPLYWEESAGRLWLEIGRFNEDLLYVESLPWGIGSNDIGLDRGQLGGEKIVRFERIGPKVLMV